MTASRLALALLLVTPALAAAQGDSPDPAVTRVEPAQPAPAAPPPARAGGRAWWSTVAERGWLGVRMSSREQLRQALDSERLPEEWIAVQNAAWLAEEWDGKGALVLQVFPESPAEKSGLLPGDVVLSFNGIRTGSPGELAFVVQRAVLGHDGDLEVLRDGETRRVLVEVGMHPEDKRRLEEEKAAADAAKPAAAPAAGPARP